MTQLVDNPTGDTTIVLAHGAGAPMDSPFMNAIAAGLADGGLRVVRFEFPYMAQRRMDGKKRGPNTAAILLDTWRTIVAEQPNPGATFIGGKSMGGRIASMVADELGVSGVVCFGYPFHPPGKPEKVRTEHLERLTTPCRILQGTRDPFGTPDDVAGYSLSDAIEVIWLDSGDHSLVPLKKSGRTEAQNLAEAVAHTLEFVHGAS